MSTTLISSIIILYFIMLLTIAWITSKNADSNDFFTAQKQSPWYLVAFGMIGTSISGATFISVPGKVGVASFSYFQLVIGYLAGYLVVALVLMPLYYRLNLISIYSYLDQRFGKRTYQTGSFFFLLSRTIGSSLRLYLAAAVLQLFIFDALNIEFWVTVSITILLIWVYTFKGGIKTIIWTDTIQTLFLITALITSIVVITKDLNLTPYGLIENIYTSKYSQIFFLNDPNDAKFFIKQFIGGMFITIVMTGLDQDLMQKNLTCKNIKEAKKNMFWFSVILVGVNLLFLTLGALLYIYCDIKEIAIPKRTDDLYPLLALSHFGIIAGIAFLLGIIASSYASADSALASLTTSFCIDFLNFKDKDEPTKQKQKFYVHLGFSLVLLISILIFRMLNNSTVIDSVLKMASYTYGPLLGLFTLGIFTKYKINDRLSPYICFLSPIITYVVVHLIEDNFSYKFSFELLLFNGTLTFVGLLISGYFLKTSEK